MNILPKKSWHVRNKDNVAKVRKDEEEARQQEKKRLQQIALAEQEARTKLLRKKARKRQSDDNLQVDVAYPSSGKQQPINFFQDIGPDGKPYSSTSQNVEHEEEKKQEKEKQEKKIGLLTYLGQSAVETLPEEERPWYFKPPSREEKALKSSKSQIADAKRKANLDPLTEMKESLRKKKKHKEHKKKSKHTKTKLVTEGLSTEDKLAKLRKERIEREAREKQRSKELLQRHYGISTNESSSTPSSSTFIQKYSNQFNPHLARNNKT